ncbi:MAG: glycine cleavage system aminomethyltransferase GcvT [Bacteroidota bacterium]|nr:glycine cleavage system aminomethyltransferase GcvT [Bacteroidota bacterium]
MKELVLSDIHESIGGKMVDFAGYNMPVQYEGVNAEHHTVRNTVGVFDVSHMGEIFIKGRNSLEFLQYVLSNNIEKLNPGKIQYTYMPNDQGGIVDDLLVYHIDNELYMLVVNASNIDKDLQWLHRHNNLDVIIKDRSNNYSLLALQGPQSIDLLQQLTNIQLEDIRYYNFVIGTISGIDNIIISRTGYTGELGFELYIKNKNVKKIWYSLFSTNIELKPIGLAARDTLRLEKGFCLYGNDIDETTSPIEAGLGWITKFSKRFINSENLKKQHEKGIERRLVGLILQERGIARKGYSIFSSNKEEIGTITSGTMSPTLKQAIAMGYIKSEYSKTDELVYVKIRDKYLKAKITSFPFVE